MSLDVSPDGKLIAFELLNDIYTIPAAGGNATAVHRGNVSQHSPEFSPDGQTLAYISDESGADNVWLSNVDGSNARQLSHEKTAKIASPTWSADGKSVAVVVSQPHILGARNPSIRSFDVQSGKQTTIVSPPASGKDVQEPEFSNDGKWLYYTERVAGDHYVYMNTGLKNFVIKRKSLASGNSRTYVTGFGGATTPQLSPNGATMAFVRRSGADTVLYAMDTATREQRPIYGELERDLHGDYLAQEKYYPQFDWFPDNRHVAIWSRGKLRKIDTRTGNVQVIPFQLKAKHQLMPAVRVKQNLDPDTVTIKAISQLAPNPTKNIVVFRALGKLWRAPLDGSTLPVRMNDESAAQSDPSWSRDGRYLTYIAWYDQRGSSLRIVDTKDNSEREVLRNPAMIREPRLSPAGKQVAYRVMAADPSIHAEGQDTGLFITPIDKAKPRFLAEAAKLLRFSKDGNKLFFLAPPAYYSLKAVDMRSINADGTDEKTLAIAPTADTSDFALSPDAQWLAYKAYNLPFVIPFSEGKEPRQVSFETQPEAKLLNAIGGYELTWAPDSSDLFWALGNNIFSAGPDSYETQQEPVTRLLIEKTIDRPKGLLALSGATILTMSNGVISNGVVLIDGNRIKAVGKKRDIRLPKNTKVITLTDKYIMPGLFDAHGHIDCCFGTGVAPQQHPTRYAALAYGVTTNFDPYSNDLASYESGEMTLTGDLVGPRWLSSGQVIYGLAGKPDSTFHPLTSLQDAQTLMLRRQALGPSILKSYKQPARQQRQWLLEAARSAKYMVDAEGAGQFYNNINMVLDGHTNLEHNLPVANYYDDLKQLFAASDVSVTPTLIVTFGELFGENYIYQTQRPWDEEKVKTFIPEVNNSYNPIAGPPGAPLAIRGMHTIHVPDEIYDIGFRSVGRSIAALDEAGVTVNVGSHGQASGIAMHWEMLLMAEAGMKPDRILHAATINVARTYGLDHQLGSLEVGKLADLIVLDRNPLDDIRNTNSVSYTMINGRLYDAYSMNEIGLRNIPRKAFYWEKTASIIENKTNE